MRIGLIAAFLVCLHPGLDSPPAAGKHDAPIVDEQFFVALERIIPARFPVSSRDSFSVESASWNESNRSLYVDIIADHEKGTLLTLTGLPESTMLDTFRISSNHGARYVLPLALDQAAPCRVTVRSAFTAETIPVANAPQACLNMLQLSGFIDVGSGHNMANGRVTVAINEVVFATFADDTGHFSLQVYSHVPDAKVTITATGKIDNNETVLQLYTGNVDKLLRQKELGASVWAKEILGRRHQRRMLAAVDSLQNQDIVHQTPQLLF
jgi:hypothetical protein